MSGSGGSPIPPGDNPRNPSCLDLFDRVPLSSPNPHAVRNLTVGTTLTVAAQTPTGPLVAINAAGVLVGSILTSRLVAFLRCIESGTDYAAIVTSIQGGLIEVEVRPI